MYIPEFWVGLIVGVVIGVSFVLGLGSYVSKKDNRRKDK